MFVPAWVVWLVAAVLLGPPALFGLFVAYVYAMDALFPPPDGSILDPASEEMTRGTQRHRRYATPYLPEGHPFRNPPVKASPSTEAPRQDLGAA